jgi:hypothetical protein
MVFLRGQDAPYKIVTRNIIKVKVNVTREKKKITKKTAPRRGGGTVLTLD